MESSEQVTRKDIELLERAITCIFGDVFEQLAKEDLWQFVETDHKSELRLRDLKTRSRAPECAIARYDHFVVLCGERIADLSSTAKTNEGKEILREIQGFWSRHSGNNSDWFELDLVPTLRRYLQQEPDVVQNTEADSQTHSPQSVLVPPEDSDEIPRKLWEGICGQIDQGFESLCHTDSDIHRSAARKCLNAWYQRMQLYARGCAGPDRVRFGVQMLEYLRNKVHNWGA